MDFLNFSGLFCIYRSSPQSWPTETPAGSYKCVEISRIRPRLRGNVAFQKKTFKQKFFDMKRKIQQYQFGPLTTVSVISVFVFSNRSKCFYTVLIFLQSS